MKRKLLEDLGIEKGDAFKIMTEKGKDIETAKGGLQALQAELENAKAAIGERGKQLKELKTAAGDNEELKNKISVLQTDNEKQKAVCAAQVKHIK